MGSILVGYAFEVFVFASRIVSQWRRQARGAETVNAIANRLTLDLERASDLEMRGDSALVLWRDSGTSTIYRSTSGVIFRNDVSMNSLAVVYCVIHAGCSGDLIQFKVKGCIGEKEIIATCRIHIQSSSVARFSRAARTTANSAGEG